MNDDDDDDDGGEQENHFQVQVNKTYLDFFSSVMQWNK